MGINIKIERIKKKISQKNLAKMVGISRITLSRIENSNTKKIKHLTLVKIAHELNVAVESLME